MELKNSLYQWRTNPTDSKAIRRAITNAKTSGAIKTYSDLRQLVHALAVSRQVNSFRKPLPPSKETPTLLDAFFWAAKHVLKDKQSVTTATGDITVTITRVKKGDSAP
jgi:hypothetical protein